MGSVWLVSLIEQSDWSSDVTENAVSCGWSPLIEQSDGSSDVTETAIGWDWSPLIEQSNWSSDVTETAVMVGRHQESHWLGDVTIGLCQFSFINIETLENYVYSVAA